MFLGLDPRKEFSNRIRDIIGALSVIFIVIFLFATPTIGRTLELAKFNFSAKDTENIDTNNDEIIENQNGGDVIVPIPEPQVPEFVGVALDESKLTASKFIVKDVDTGMVLYGKDVYSAHSLASITKLMSALVILDSGLDWNATTTITDENIFDNHVLGGEELTVGELWDLALVGSSNKSILALAEMVAERSEFVMKMNEKARELGMIDSHFFEPTGLNENNISTASDTVILLNEALSKEKIKQAVTTLKISGVGGRKDVIWNTDWLLLGWVTNDFAEIVGGKTGYIPQSGYNFTVQVKDKSGAAVNVVVFGSESNEARFAEAKFLAEWAFKNYSWPSLINQ